MNLSAPTHHQPDLPSLCLAVTEHAPLPIATVEGTTHIIRYANPAFCRLLGKSAEQLVGRPLSELLPAKDACISLIDRVYQMRKPESYTEQDPSKPHPVFWSYTMWPVVTDACLVGVMIQVTETAEFHGTKIEINEALMLGALRQHELTEAAEKINEQLQVQIIDRQKTAQELAEKARLLDLSLDAIIVRDFEGHILYWNHGAEELYGWSRTEAIGKNLHALLQTEFPKPLEQIVKRLHENNRWTGELVQTKRNGERITVLVRKALDRDSEGQPAAVLESLTDISERIRAREALLKSEERYRTLFNSMDEGFCVIEMIFDEQNKPVDYRFLEVNPAFAKQADSPDPTGKRVREIAPHHEAHWFELYGKVAQTGVPVRFVNRASAYHAWFDVNAFRLGGPESRKVAVLFNNITERKNIEEALVKAKEQLDRYAGNLENEVADRTTKLRESIKSLESLTYTLAHDLRAPIRAMKTLTEAMIEDVPLNDLGQDYAKKIDVAAARMDLLVNDLLDYGQLTHLEFPIKPIDLKAQIKRVMEESAPDILARHAVIEVREPLPVVSGNVTLVEQVLSNLLRNAIKFIKPGVPPKVVFRAETRGAMARIWVEDNGIGIAPEYHSKIFGVFQRLHTTEEFSGTGVGLAIVQRAVERMGGSTGLESEVGEGSRFWFELPLAKS